MGGKKGKSKKGPSTKEKPIKHNAVTFQLFGQLKLDAPVTLDDIPATLEKLQEQLEDYQQKVKDWEVNREEIKKQIMEGTYVPEEKKEEKEEEKEAESKEEEKEEEK